MQSLKQFYAWDFNILIHFFRLIILRVVILTYSDLAHEMRRPRRLEILFTVLKNRCGLLFTKKKLAFEETGRIFPDMKDDHGKAIA